MSKDKSLLLPFIGDKSSRQTTSFAEARRIVVSDGKRRPLRILDLGCGEANSFDDFSKLGAGCSWVGLDIAESQEVLLRSREDCTVLTYDGINIPTGDCSFDLVYSRQVFEHVRHPERLLAQVLRVLAPGGRFVGSTSQLEPFHSRSFFNYTPLGFATLLVDSGFEKISVKPGIDGRSLIMRRLASTVRLAGLFTPFFEHTAVRLRVEQNQLVDVFGEIGVGVDGLKCA